MREKSRPAAGEALNPPEHIEADQVIVEIVDKNTGQTFRRQLSIKYCETENGIVLVGETMDGAPSQITFLSEVALLRIKELFGKGADVPRCDHEPRDSK